MGTNENEIFITENLALECCVPRKKILELIYLILPLIDDHWLSGQIEDRPMSIWKFVVLCMI